MAISPPSGTPQQCSNMNMVYRSLMRKRNLSMPRRLHLAHAETDHTPSSPNLNAYLQQTQTAQAGFNYHLISVFGSQSTGKSTLLNYLFATEFGVMSETDRRQTTKGIWMSKNKREAHDGPQM